MSRLLLLSNRRNQFLYTTRALAVAPASLIAYWPLAEPGGSVAFDASPSTRNGAYTAVTLAQPGIGDGRTSASFDGSTSVCNIFSASLDAAFNNGEGTMSAWVRVSGVGAWTDGVARRIVRLAADASTNTLMITKNTTNNQLQFNYTAGGTAKAVTRSAVSTTAWIHMALTWSKTADQLKAYFAGIQEGTTQTGLGVWAGALSSTRCAIGSASNTAANVWDGLLAGVGVWSAPLTAAQILTLATIA